MQRNLWKYSFNRGRVGGVMRERFKKFLNWLMDLLFPDDLDSFPFQ